MKSSRAGRYIRLAATPLALAALGSASAWLYDLTGFLHSFAQGIAVYIIAFIAQFALYLGASYLVLKREASGQPSSYKWIALVVVLIFGTVFRAQLVDQPPYLSSDIYRYIWDGRVQSEGINPYRYIPVEEELAYLRDDKIYAQINRRDFAHTIYPPAAQAVFLGIYLARPSSVTGFKVAMSLFDALAALALVLALARSGLDPARVIIFAWHPLVVWEAAHSGHIESAAMAFMALALLAWTYDKRALTGVALALAALVKLYPALLLPLFIMKRGLPERPVSDDAAVARKPIAGRPGPFRLFELFDRLSYRTIFAFVATVALAYLPYIGAGWGVLGYLPGYLKEEGFVHAGNRYFLLALAREILPLPTPAYSAMAALALAGLALWLLFAPRRDATDLARGATRMIGLFLILSTPRYDWYIAWIIPFLVFAPGAAWLYLSGASVLLYLLWLTGDYPNIPLWLGAAIYLPVLLLLAWERMRARPSSGIRL
ncbi:MAG TPA: glycosyltransferase 87 family protein [Blastocatellia bacterium]|nr:glycosyltransferase 87 family protein [Blastocatellia bacterium]